MAQWKETLEPYVRVTEQVKSAALTPTAGEDLIVGAVIMSDSGPATPTLITSQSEFLKTFATSDITEDYMKEINKLYASDPGSNVASTMWLNAYRLAGSVNLLVSRATKGEDILYAKSLEKNDSGSYILRDTEILKRSEPFYLTLDKSDAYIDGWGINISEVGIFGNRVTDEGAQYDYDVYDLQELVEKLNETNKFFCPKYTFYKGIYDSHGILQRWEKTDDGENADSVYFDEIYLGSYPLDKSDSRTVLDENDENRGLIGIILSAKLQDNDSEEEEWKKNFTIDINKGKSWGEFDAPRWYVTNTFNSNTDLIVRVRRFNHNAVRAKVLSESEVAQGVSPWVVLPAVLDTYTHAYGYNMSKPGAEKVLYYDFYEFAIKDPSVSSEYQIFNVGNIPGRGDIDTASLNDSLGMMQLHLPDDLKDLDINYFDYNYDDGDFLIDDAHIISNLNAMGLGKGDLTVDSEGRCDSIDPEGHWIWPNTEEDVSFEEVKNAIDLCSQSSNHRYSGTELRAEDLEVLKKEKELPADGSTYIIGYPGAVNKIPGNKDFAADITDGIYNFEFSYSGGEKITNGLYDVSKSETSPQICLSGYIIKEDEGNTDIAFSGNEGYKVAVTTNDGTVVECSPVINPNLDTDIQEPPVYYSAAFVLSNLPEEDGFVRVSISDANDQLVGTYYLYPSIASKDFYTTDRTEPSESSFVTGVRYYTQLGETQVRVNAKISTDSCLLEVTNRDLKGAWDNIEADERYIVEGITDLGCTYPELQNYIANMAINSNYFYPVSLINSTNYMALANHKKKITKASHKLYYLAPWDYDNGTTGFTFGVSPSTLYWEVIGSNRRNNHEFAAAFGQTRGIISPVNLSKEFKATERRLLLTKKINTVFHDLYIDRYYINDNVTATEEDNVLKEECNARFQIRISKAIPLLLNQFKGRQNTATTRKDVKYAIDYWFTSVVASYGDTVLGHLVTCDESNNTDADVRANILNVKVEVRYANSVKYIEVLNIAYPVGIDFEG